MPVPAVQIDQCTRADNEGWRRLDLPYLSVLDLLNILRMLENLRESSRPPPEGFETTSGPLPFQYGPDFRLSIVCLGSSMRKDEVMRRLGS